VRRPEPRRWRGRFWVVCAAATWVAIAVMCYQLATEPRAFVSLVGTPASLVEQEKDRLLPPVLAFRATTGRYPASLLEAGVKPSQWSGAIYIAGDDWFSLTIQCGGIGRVSDWTYGSWNLRWELSEDTL
jgi:hypothetical protein